MELYIVAGAGLLLVTAFTLLALMTSTMRRHGAAIDKQHVQNEWQRITVMGKQPDQTARYAVIEADKLLDYVLKQRGYRGETMGERLKAAAEDFNYLDDIWSAHKLRNKLVHESHYEADNRLVQRALKQFHQGLKDMGAL